MTVIRILLFLLPLFILISMMIWWSQGKRRMSDLSEKDIKYLRFGLVGTLVLLVVAFVMLKLTETSSSDRDAEYIPPHMEDGKIVPGAFKENPKPDEEVD